MLFLNMVCLTVALTGSDGATAAEWRDRERKLKRRGGFLGNASLMTTGKRQSKAKAETKRNERDVCIGG
jgi:hypothetical protein